MQALYKVLQIKMDFAYIGLFTQRNSYVKEYACKLVSAHFCISGARLDP